MSEAVPANFSQMLERTPAEGKVTGPVILHQGVYRVFQKPDGTLRIQYQKDDSETEEFFEIPGAFFKIAEKMRSGKMNMASTMAEMTKLMMNMR